MVYAVDFDNTLAFTKFPQIIEPNHKMIAFCKVAQAQGHKVILWTCRVNEDLKAAVEYCKRYGLVFDAVNDHLPEQKAKWKNDTRKIWADYYIDDKNLAFVDIDEMIDKLTDILIDYESIAREE